MASSIGFQGSVSFPLTIQATGSWLLPWWDCFPLNAPAFAGHTLMPFGFHLTMNTLPSEGLLLRPTTSLPPSLDMAPLIRAPEGLQPSRTTRCSAHPTGLSVTPYGPACLSRDAG